MRTKNKSYTIKDIPYLLKLYKIKHYKLILNSIPHVYLPVNLHVNCLFIYSDQVDTLEEILAEHHESGNICSNKYSKIMGDGDGTVNLASLKACECYKKVNSKKVKIKVVHKKNHQEILKSSLTFAIINKHIKKRLQL